MRAPSSSRMLVEIARRDVLEHLVGGVHPLLDGLLAQDRDAGLEVGRLDVGEQAPLEPGAHALLEAGQLLGRQVGGDDDLLVGVVQRVEGVEELLLRLHLALQELDVVDQQDVDVAVAALEVGRLVVADAVDEVVGELLGVHVAHPDVGVEVARVVADRVQQVGLAQPGLAVDEERVVGLGRRLGDRDRGGVGEAVARADDEGVEGVLRVQAGRLDLDRLVLGDPGARPAAAAAHPGAERRGLVGASSASASSSSVRVAVSGGGRAGLVGVAVQAQRGVDRHGQPDLLAELVGQRVGHLLAHAGLEDVLGVVVRAPRAGRSGRSGRRAGSGAGRRAAGPGCRHRRERRACVCQTLPNSDLRLRHVWSTPLRVAWMSPARSLSRDHRKRSVHTVIHRLWIRREDLARRRDANNQIGCTANRQTGNWQDPDQEIDKMTHQRGPRRVVAVAEPTIDHAWRVGRRARGRLGWGSWV